jgi:hypothetical protein
MSCHSNFVRRRCRVWVAVSVIVATKHCTISIRTSFVYCKGAFAAIRLVRKHLFWRSYSVTFIFIVTVYT